MGKVKFLSIFFVLNCLCIFNLYAATRLVTPEELQIEQLNKEQKDKLQNVQYTETLAIPNQYKGKLKYTEGREEVHLKDARLFFGAGGRYTFSKDLTVKAEEIPQNHQYFNQKNVWNMDGNFNFYVSGGLYWRNGIRIEFEYSQMTLETNDYGKNFAKYNGPDTNGKGIIFNQYLQTSGEITNYINDLGQVQYTTLTNNMLPVAELSVKTYMLNFIFERVYAKSKIRPYVGVGLGVITGDITTFVNEGSSTVFGGQVMVGLSYPISDESLVFYLGYRGIFMQDMEQTFTRITDVNSAGTRPSGSEFNGNTYFNLNLVKSKEKYNVQTHNIDLGIRFFF